MALLFDAIIVGGGPAGAAAAKACAEGGLRALLVEKRVLPRPKACSGILVRDSIDLVSRHFGAIPPDVLAEPSVLQSLRMHFPSGRTLDVPLGGACVRRGLFDQWLCRAAGVEISERTTAGSFEESADAVTVRCTRGPGEERVVRGRVLIAADGGTSRIVGAIAPERHGRLAWYAALQEAWDTPCSLEPGRFHFFAFPSVSPYSSAYVKDGLLFTEVVAAAGDSAEAAMKRFREFLKRELGLREGGVRVSRLGCRVAYAATGNLFCFGSGRILVAGEASGLLNPFGEGISSALASGRIAGEAAVRAFREGRVPGVLYREAVEAQRQRTLRQFRYGAYLAGRDVTFDVRKGLAGLPVRGRIRLVADLVEWLASLGGPACSRPEGGRGSR
jgi:flavin-dependent dehydrogenase